MSFMRSSSSIVCAPAELLVAVGDDARQVLARQGQVVKRHFRMRMSLKMTRPTVVSTRPFGLRGTSSIFVLSLSTFTSPMTLLLDRQPHIDAGVDAELLLGVGGDSTSAGAGERLALAGFACSRPFRRASPSGSSNP